jgi:molybdenum cofactor biosynthesis enzyme MoaA
MITIFTILTTWYLTKIYYSKTLKVSIYDLEAHNLMQATCHKCAQTTVISIDDMRNPFYCMNCKVLR